jgi:hypothetical protein
MRHFRTDGSVVTWREAANLHDARMLASWCVQHCSCAKETCIVARTPRVWCELASLSVRLAGFSTTGAAQVRFLDAGNPHAGDTKKMPTRSQCAGFLGVGRVGRVGSAFFDRQRRIDKVGSNLRVPRHWRATPTDASSFISFFSYGSAHTPRGPAFHAHGSTTVSTCHAEPPSFAACLVEWSSPQPTPLCPP